MKMVMGGETEYAISALSARGNVVNPATLLDQLFEHIKRRLDYTSQSSRGRFLSNAGLIYVDAGLHLEWSTPEVTSPFEVVRYLEAGDRIVHDLATSYKNSGQVSEIFCSRANVDYVSGTLWAAHESYQHDVPPADLPAQLTPFLASRVILGGGGWDRTSPGLRFTLSPRAHFITRAADRDSQTVRPIFHTKNESLSGTGSHRLHVACSESLCSQTANVLRFGTTALVLALLERGIYPGHAVTLVAPVKAMQRFALDPAWRAAIVGVPRRRMSALDIQRHYLECVERHFEQLQLPDWAERVCRMWRSVLQDFAADRSRLEATLDWAIKRRLFERQLARRGIAWALLPWWNVAVDRLSKCWARTGAKQPFEIRFAVQSHARLAAEQERLARSLHRRGLDYAQLGDFAAARHELFELDAKFGELGESGVFNALDAAGVLRHRVDGLDIASAITDPPQDTRARIRGNVVRRLSAAGMRYGAEWMRVFDYANRRTLDLRDPFEVEERWSELTDSSRREST